MQLASVVPRDHSSSLAVVGSVHAGDAGEGVEVALVGVGERVEVLLGGLDLGVAHPDHDRFQVGPAESSQEAWA